MGMTVTGGMMTDALPKPPSGGNGRLLPPDAGRDRPLFVVA
ncbi:MAG: cell division transport system permease protein, partial [Maricaulis maris]